MPPIDFVRSSRFAKLARKLIVQVRRQNERECVKAGMFYILDRKEFVKNNKWVLQIVIGSTKTEDGAVARWSAWGLTEVVETYNHFSAKWRCQQRQRFFYPDEVIPVSEVVDGWYKDY